MPGKHLNDKERRLLREWDRNGGRPLLTGVMVEGNPGLRGIKDLDISFDYPVSVICGKNGCGKTTVLGLAALAFHPPKGHQAFQARNQNKRTKDRAYYTFSDFFYKGPNDPNISGVKIEWKFKNWKHPSKQITKQTSKWMKYPSRPERPVHYIGASRIIPAIEYSVLRHHFNSRFTRAKLQVNSKTLDSYFNEQLVYILERDYAKAGHIHSGRYSLRICNYGSEYSGFNMGAGEDTLIDLLYILQETPEGSLIVIEEVELGLHPLAQKRLAQVLIAVALRKNLQIITSSHSWEFIDNLPAKSRILLESGSSKHQVTNSCTTRFALSHLSGYALPELRIYCEDRLTEKLLAYSLKGVVRERVQITSVGDKGAVAKQFLAHKKGGYSGNCVIVYDGDVTKKEACNWVKHELSCDEVHDSCKGCGFIMLPSGYANPEEWILGTVLNNEKYITDLAKEMNYEDELDTIRKYLEEVRALPDKHNIFYELSKKTNLPEDDILKALVKTIQSDKGLVEVIDFIEKAL